MQIDHGQLGSVDAAELGFVFSIVHAVIIRVLGAMDKPPFHCGL